MKKIFISLFLLIISLSIKAQSNDDLINLLIKNGSITKQQGDSLKAKSSSEKKANFVEVGSKIKLAGYTQLRYRQFDEQGKIDQFDIRRARLDVRGAISPRWNYRLQVEFANSVKLLDAYAEYKLNDYLNVTLGQAKIPFSLENLASSSKLDLIDRSQVVEALVGRGKDVIGNNGGRDIGVQVGGTIFKYEGRAFVDYKIGVFNGLGINTGDNNQHKDIAARLIIHPIKGLDISGAIYDGEANIASVNSKRDRYGFDLNYNWQNWVVSSEYIHGEDGQKTKEGFYLQTGYYFLDKKLQIVAKYDTYDADKAVSDNASTLYVLGATYNFNNNARFQINYTFKDEQGISVDNNYAAAQFQIRF
ncbi:MAG: porin [Lutibacter sp.]|nr:porin [Lutibacter sp.]